MKVELKPTQDPEKLRENLETRVEKVEENGEKLEVELPEDELEVLERVPGIEKIEAEHVSREGVKGRPVQEEAYARLDSKRDLARAVVATIDGYDLRILHTGKDWDLKILRRFNPDIKHLKTDEPSEVLGIEKTLDTEDEEREVIEMELSEKEVDTVCRFAHPHGEKYSEG